MILELIIFYNTIQVYHIDVQSIRRVKVSQPAVNIGDLPSDFNMHATVVGKARKEINWNERLHCALFSGHWALLAQETGKQPGDHASQQFPEGSLRIRQSK